MALSAAFVALSALLLLAGVYADSWAGKFTVKDSAGGFSSIEVCKLVKDFHAKRLVKVLEVSAALDNHILSLLSNSTIAPFYRVQAVLLAARYRADVADHVWAAAIASSEHCVSVGRPQQQEDQDIRAGDRFSEQHYRDVEHPFVWMSPESRLGTPIRSNTDKQEHRETPIRDGDEDDKELV